MRPQAAFYITPLDCFRRTLVPSISTTCDTANLKIEYAINDNEVDCSFLEV